MRLNSIGRFTLYCMLACFIAAILISFARAGLLDEHKCKNPGTALNLAEAVQTTDERLIACFNYQQDLAKKRDADYQTKMKDLELRILKLEAERAKLR